MRLTTGFVLAAFVVGLSTLAAGAPGLVLPNQPHLVEPYPVDSEPSCSSEQVALSRCLMSLEEDSIPLVSCCPIWEAFRQCLR